MPTYEYRCKSCGEHLEVVQSFTDDALTVHDACGGELRKVFGAVGISFKGSGFYKTDSRGSSSSSSSGSDSSGSDSSSTTDSSSGASSSDSSKGSGKGDNKSKSTKGAKKDTASAASS